MLLKYFKIMVSLHLKVISKTQKYFLFYIDHRLSVSFISIFLPSCMYWNYIKNSDKDKFKDNNNFAPFLF